MSKWKIQPSGVKGVLDSVEGDNETLGKALTEAKFEAVFEGLTWAPAITSAVPTAVGNLLEDQRTNLDDVVNRVTAGMLGVSNAVIAYNNGQETMSGTYQKEMLKSAESGDFTYFVDHGQKG